MEEMEEGMRSRNVRERVNAVNAMYRDSSKRPTEQTGCVPVTTGVRARSLGTTLAGDVVG